MSLSISSASGMSSMMNMSRMPARPDPSQMVQQAFSKLDTEGKGYIDQTDLQNALSGLSSEGDSAASAEQIFTALDADSDGKVTQSEMSESLNKLAEQLEAQFNSARMGQAMGGMQGAGGMPPPPPPGDDAGLSKDQLSQMASDASASGTSQATELSSLVENFEAADTDEDGKVSFKEAMAYKEKAASEATSSESGATVTAADSESSRLDAKVMQRVMQLLGSYRSDSESVTRGASVSASI